MDLRKLVFVFAAFASGCAISAVCCGMTALLIIAVLAALLFGISRPDRKIFFILTAALLSGAGLFALRLLAVSRSDIPALAGEVRLILTDPNLSGIPDVAPQKLLTAEMTHPFQGRVLCRLPQGSPCFKYGTILAGTAKIYPAASGRAVKLHHRKNSLAEVRFVTCREISRRETLYSRLLDFRDILIRRICGNFASAKNRALCTALFFGISHGIDKSDMQKFIASGTVHLFSVSGMHVAVIAALILSFLRNIAWQRRFAVTLLICGIYVLMTGANPPAIRAFIMLAAWALARTFCRKTSPVETMSAAGLLMLICDPLLITDIGVLYSFAVTAGLLLISRHRTFICNRSSAPERLFAGKKLRLCDRTPLSLTGKVLTAFTYSCGAFLTSCGITLFTSGLLSPGQIAANMLLALLSTAVFVLILLSLVIPPVQMLSEKVIEITSRWCSFCADAFAPQESMIPVLLTVIVYYLFLAACFCRLKWPVAVTFALLAILSLPCRMLWESRDPRHIAVITSDSGSFPAVLLCDGGESTLVDLPDYRMAAEVRKHICRCSKGITLFYTSANTAECCRGLAALTPRHQPGRVLLKQDRKITPAAEQILQKLCPAPAAEAENYPGICKISRGKEKLDIEYFFSGSKLKAELNLLKMPQGWNAVCRIPGKKISKTIRFSKEAKTTVYEF